MHADTMASDRTKVIVIAMFAAVAVAAIAGIYWFVKIHQPAERLGDAQAEILAWDARWIQMRSCLLGASPGSSKVSEALAIRELSPDPWERKTCTQLVSQLSRGEAEDTRVPAVEEAWRVLDKAAGKVAVSFISHVDPGGDAMRKKPDPLPVALDELEAAYGALRATAELPPVKAPMDGKPLPAAQIIPVAFDGKRILSIQEPYVSSRSGMLAFGTVDGAEVQFQFAAGKPPALTAVGAGMQRAIPDGTWGARAIPDAIEVGQLDAKGVMTAPAVLALPGPTQVIAAVGTWADGVVVYGAGNQLVVARCKAGACTPTEKKPYTVRSMAFSTDAATGYTTLVWADDKSQMSALHLDPSALDAKLEPLGKEGFPKLMCLTADSAWLQYSLEGTVGTMELKRGAHADVPDDEHALMGCSPGGAVFYKDFGEPSYRRCAQGKCDAVLTKSQKHRVPVAVTATGVVGVEARGAVLAVRKGGPTDFYAVPNGLVPLVAMTDGNSLDVLAWTADGLVIARASAR
jgi:hypothetical protein